MPKKPAKNRDLGARIASAREAAGLSQTGLAKVLKVTRSSVSQWESGTTDPTSERLRALAMRTNVRFEWLATGRGDRSAFHAVSSEDVAAGLDPPPPKTIKLKGYVGAGGQAHYYALADEDYETVEAPRGATDQTVAVEIKGASLGPLLESWLVYYKDVRSPVESDLIGELCVVGLADDRILIKKIQSNGKGGYNLISNNPAEPPIKDALIEWAAKVTDMKPR